MVFQSKRTKHGRLILIENSTKNSSTNCAQLNCDICKITVKDTKVKSTVTNCYYATKIKPQTSCQTANLIYLLTCNTCKKQYVGETGRKLKVRAKEHDNNVKNPKKKCYIYQHFRTNCCKTFNVQIIETLEDCTEKERKSREDMWIRLLMTPYPYGLNDNISGIGNLLNPNTIITSKNTPYFNFKFPRVKKTRGKKNKNKNNSKTLSNFDLNKSIFEFKRLYFGSSKDFKVLKTMVPKNLEQKRKIESLVSKIKEPEKPKIVCIKQDFFDEMQTKISYHSIFQQVFKSYKIKFPNIKIVTVFKQNAPISTRIINSKKFLLNLTEEEMLKLSQNECSCQAILNTRTDFKNLNAEHILTGDFNFVNDNNLRKILSKGMKYRITPKPVKKSVILQNIKESIQKVMKNNNLKKLMIRDVQSEIMEKIESKVNRLKCCNKTNRNEHVDFKKLNDLQKNYIISNTDKATNNYTFTCKKLYIEIMNKEMGVTKNENNIFVAYGNNTYKPTEETLESIMNRHNKMEQRFFTKINEENNKLPIIYGIPKLHKNPVKYRFITAANECSMKNLACLLQTILKHMATQFKNYCEKALNRSNKTLYWSINGSYEFINKVKYIKKKNLKIYTADFSSLFTNLSHTEVLIEMGEFIGKMFSNANKRYINVKGDKCWYSDKKDGISLDKYDVYELVKFVLKESYTVYGNMIFQQVNGIPQGGNASPQIADNTLAWKEYKYLLKNDMQSLGIHLGSRYMDDLNLLHNDKFKPTKLKEIYGEKLQFEQTNQNSMSSNYLDLNLEVTQQGITTKLYNKTDDYNFKVIRITDYSSYMPANIKNAIIFGEILRIKRASSDAIHFEERIKTLQKELQEVNYPNKLFDKMLTKVSQKYF